MQFVMFAKHLQEWPLEKSGRVVKSMGFDGLDLTVRGGGYVLPENVTKELGPAVKTLADCGLGVPFITTNILAAEEEHTEAILATAAGLGIREYKIGYHTYKQFGQYKEALEKARRDIRGLEALNLKHGIRGNLHIHSNNFVTANPAIVWWLLQDTDPAALGAYIDPGHMFIEGGKDVWRQGIELLADRTNLMACKSMAWQFDPAGRTGKWVDRMQPLHRGMVDWVKVWQCLAKTGFDGVVSLHSEYQGSHSWYDMTIEELVDQTREDFAYLKACREKALAG